MSRRRKSHKNTSTGTKKPLVLLLLLVIIGFFGYQYIRTGLSVLQKDRVNIVYYGKSSAMYSVGLADAGNYVIPFYPDLKIEIPGGYGMYRVGAIGKLVALEKKPDIFRKAFSHASSSFVDYYFYSPSQEVYFGGGEDVKPFFPNAVEFLTSKSSASVGERIALVYIMLKTPPQDFTVLGTVETQNGEERLLLTENFYQQYQGHFYRKSYREEKKDVQILYSKNYESAQQIGQILEGNGIRVSDISQSTESQDYCRVIEESGQHSQTAIAISKFFDCELTKGEADIYDILFELSTRERDW